MQLSDLPHEKIFSMQGIGDTIGKKIIELLDTGKIKVLKYLLKKPPHSGLQMLKIKGIGPKKEKLICNEGYLFYTAKGN